MRPPLGRTARAQAILIGLLVWSGAAAGCLGADARPEAEPLSLMEAVRLAEPAAKALAPTAKLIAFEGHEGPVPTHLRGLVATYKATQDTTFDAKRADGRVYQWAILFATYQGGMIRAVVHANPHSVEATWQVNAGDPQLRYLWGLNMGGRLIHDSTTVMQTLRTGDSAIHRYLRETPAAAVSYTSEIAPSDVTGHDDMAYRIDIGYETGRNPSYAFYGLIGHFSGRLLATGDFDRGEEQRTVTLVDEEFRLGLTQRTVAASQGLPIKAYDARLTLELEGDGRYTFELFYENKTAIARYVGNVLRESVQYTKDLGDLEPGGYTVRAEAFGVVTFKVQVDGVVVV